jgi:hypothetical protein
MENRVLPRKCLNRVADLTIESHFLLKTASNSLFLLTARCAYESPRVAGGLFQYGVVALLGFGWRDVADRLQ